MEFKVFHCADLHHNNDEDLLKDTKKCTDYVVAQARERKPDLIAIAGDIWDEAVILGTQATIWTIELVQNLADVAPVVMASGTLTHDAPGSTAVFNHLRTTYPVFAADIPMQIGLTEKGFTVLVPDSPVDRLKAVVTFLPTVTKAGIVAARDLSVHEGNLEITELLRDILQGWGIINDRANVLDIPTILVGHCNITGSSLSTGQKVVGRDIEVSVADLKLAKARVNCLGHIHLAQQLNSNVFYSGSITRQNHAETEDKGFFIHHLEDERLRSEFITTPARKMVTLEADGLPDASLLGSIGEGDYVRIRYTVKEEDRHQVDDAELVRLAKKKGARDVKIDKDIIPLVTSRAEGISRLHSLADKFGKWAELSGVMVTEGLLSKLESLETKDAKSIIEQYFSKEENDEDALFAA